MTRAQQIAGLLGAAGALIVAFMAGVLSPVGDPPPVTPPSCVQALDLAGDAFARIERSFGALGQGDTLGFVAESRQFQEWVAANSPKIGDATNDCRSRAAPPG